MRGDTFISTGEEIALLESDGSPLDVAATRHDDVTDTDGQVQASSDADGASKHQFVAERSAARQDTAVRRRINDREATRDSGTSRACLIDQAHARRTRDVSLTEATADDEAVGVSKAARKVEATRATRRQGDNTRAETGGVVRRHNAGEDRHATGEGVDAVQVERVGALLGQQAGTGDHARQGQVGTIGVHHGRRIERNIATDGRRRGRGNQSAAGHDEVTGERVAGSAVQEERRTGIHRDGRVVRIRQNPGEDGGRRASDLEGAAVDDEVTKANVGVGQRDPVAPGLGERVFVQGQRGAGRTTEIPALCAADGSVTR